MKRIHHAFTMIELLTVVALIAILAAISVPNFLEAQIRSKTARTKSDMAVVVAALSAYHADYRAYPPNDPQLQALLIRMVDYRAPVVPASGVNPTPTTTPTPAGYDPRFDRDFLTNIYDEALDLPDNQEVSATIAYYATPNDSPITWYSDDPTFGTRPEDGSVTFGSEDSGFPPFEASDSNLRVLTTPIAYFTTEAPLDNFSSRYGRSGQRSASGYRYINLSQLRQSRPHSVPLPNDWHYHVSSPGPTTSYHSVRSRRHVPEGINLWLEYDPTNGTMSPGMIFRTGPSE
jgi:prepilin-type N-terminal cleavage/methylation domain-containing protein